MKVRDKSKAQWPSLLYPALTHKTKLKSGVSVAYDFSLRREGLGRSIRSKGQGKPGYLLNRTRPECWALRSSESRGALSLLSISNLGP